MKLGNINDISWFNDDEAIIEIENSSDKGFIDFLVELESSMDEFQQDITAMTEDMVKMSEGVSQSTSEIERVKESGGSGTISFVRKATRKAAKYVEEFSSSFKEYNKTLPELWDKIEMNTIGLLENDFATTDGNKEMMINYLKSLSETKKAIVRAEEGVTAMKIEMEGVVGIEKSLNKAMQFAILDLTNFLKNTEYFKGSIDKILVKSKITLGKIEFD